MHLDVVVTNGVLRRAIDEKNKQGEDATELSSIQKCKTLEDVQANNGIPTNIVGLRLEDDFERLCVVRDIILLIELHTCVHISLCHPQFPSPERSSTSTADREDH